MATWQRVSALFVLLVLFTSACSSAPEEVVAGAQAAESADLGDLAAADAGTERATSDSDASAGTSAVADDSAPVALTEDIEAQLEELEAARTTWNGAGIEDFDMQIDFDTTADEDDQKLSFENVGGRLVRVLGDDGEGAEEMSIVDILFGSIESTLLGLDEGSALFEIEYDSQFGFPVEILGQESGEDFLVVVEDFRQHDEYPPTCSAANQEGPWTPTGLAVAQSETFERLVQAIVECDFLALDHISYAQAEPVLTSFGGTSVEHLWQREAEGEPLMVTMLELLGGASTTSPEGLTTWPVEFADPGIDYLGWRMGIDVEGDWLFFIAGD